MKRLLIAGAVLAAGLAATPAAAQSFRVGDWVVGRWQGGDYYYPATVVSVNRNNIVVEYDGGRRDTLLPNQVTAFRWGRGGRVQCKWTDGEFYDASIVAMHGDGATIDVQFDDEDSPRRTQTKYCRSEVLE